jgi:hypothetical protein
MRGIAIKMSIIVKLFILTFSNSKKREIVGVEVQN